MSAENENVNTEGAEGVEEAADEPSPEVQNEVNEADATEETVPPEGIEDENNGDAVDDKPPTEATDETIPDEIKEEEVSHRSEGQTSQHTDELVKAEPSITDGTKIEFEGSLKDSPLKILYARSSLLEGLEEAKKEAAATTETIMELKNKILTYQQKENLTEEDLEEMQAIHAELMANLSKYGDTSSYLAQLTGMTQVPSSQLDMSMPPMSMARTQALPTNDKINLATVQQIVGLKEKAIINPPIPGVKEVDDIYLERYSEEKLPRIIVCGTNSLDLVPRIINCELMTTIDKEPFQRSQRPRGITTERSSPTTNHKNKQIPTETSPPIRNSHYEQQQIARKQQANEELLVLIKSLNRKVSKLNAEVFNLRQQITTNPAPLQLKICKRELYQKVRNTLPSFEKINT